MYTTVKNIRNEFTKKLLNSEFVIDKSGVKTLELIGASFLCDEEKIFGEPSESYISKEKDWYNSENCNINNMPDPPEIWKSVANTKGDINSNYGYLLYSENNYSQFAEVKNALYNNPSTRQAIAVYTRPSIHIDAFYDGKSDFICTNTVQYFIRDNLLHAVVNMRSNDVVFGFNNDFAWQKHVQEKLIDELSHKYSALQPGNIYWQVGSLHVYERHFYLVDHYLQTGEIYIPKKEYKGKYA